jgi:pimeloyl-ACP methyl ester carboxylesterase
MGEQVPRASFGPEDASDQPVEHPVNGSTREPSGGRVQRDGRVQYADNGGARIAYERCGDSRGEPLLLVTGLGSQMVFWPEGFCEQLHREGFDVVRFDNRDTGLSTRFPGRQAANPWRALLGRTEPPPYTGDDMASDGFAVMDALGWQSSHLVGISMGSAIVQYMAARRPQRVRSVACISAIVTGSPLRILAQLKYGTFLKLARQRFPDTPQGRVDRQLAIIAAMAPKDLPYDDTWARNAVRVALQRGLDGADQARHLTALKRSSRRMRYGDIKAPTVIIQGTDDPIVRLSGARAVAERIQGARLVALDRMGHGVPAARWPDLAEAIRENADRATQVRPTKS